MALTVAQYEEVVDLLRQVPPLVDRLQARRHDFVDEVLRWLKQAEAVLESNRLPAVSRVAACRALVVGAARGVQVPEVVLTGRPSRRRLEEAAASLALDRGSSALQEVIAERQAVLAEAERIARQVLAVAAAKGYLDGRDERPPQDFLEQLRHRLAGDADLASAHAHLVALVGTADVLVLLDRSLDVVS